MPPRSALLRQHLFYQSNDSPEDRYLGVVAHRALETSGCDLPPFVVVGDVVATKVDALVDRIEPDGLLAELVDLAQVALIVADLQDAIQRQVERAVVDR